MADSVIHDAAVESAVVAAAATAGDAWEGLQGVDRNVLLRRLYRYATAADVHARSPRQVLGAALGLARLAESREATAARVRVFNPTVDDDGWSCPHTVVEAIVADMPFLVDSVSAALNARGHGINLMIHPILIVRRDADGWLEGLVDVDRVDETAVVGAVAESWLHFEIERETDQARLDETRGVVESVLSDVRAAVEDWPQMRAQAAAIASALTDTPPPTVPGDECSEAAALLRWLIDDQFTFLGYREYRLETQNGEEVLVSEPATGLGLLRAEHPTSTAFSRLPPRAQALAHEPKALVITKANRRSTVHRYAYLDYVGVKRFDRDGKVIGERRIIGLFDTSAYTTSVTRIPVLRRKVADVVRMSGFMPGTHDEKDLLRFAETYPRDELFQIEPEQLWDVARQALAMGEMRQTRVFLRADVFGRFVSALVYLPREKYDTTARLKIGGILLRAYGASTLDFWPMVSESALTRLHFVVRMAPGTALPEIDPKPVVRAIREATRTWDDDFRAAVVDEFGEEHGLDLWHRYERRIPSAYREQVHVETAIADLDELAALELAHGHGEPAEPQIDLRLMTEPDVFRFALYSVGPAVPLSDLLPVFASFGAEVIAEHSYSLGRCVAAGDEVPHPPGSGCEARIYHVELRLPGAMDHDPRAWRWAGSSAASSPGLGEPDALRELEHHFSIAFGEAWRGACDVDALNRLVVVAGLTWREVAWVRAWVLYARQIGIPYTPEYMATALCHHPKITAMLANLFRVRHDPSSLASTTRRAEVSRGIDTALLIEIDRVESLGFDRVLRELRSIVLATTRTNAFAIEADETNTRALAIKVDPRALPAMPQPVPRFETWVCSPRVAGVHLRFGKKARGGIRWSDRTEDVRTEVLGLAKAQEVKNAVIVPDGAKGGFVVRRPEAAAGREAFAAQGRACYSEFISALLDITDNRIRGHVVQPRRVVCWDDEDDYLVVAADKGTATFSDTANEIAARHGFWLGDAFASGGSVGYDHKAMGITAKGAWQAVRRHFRELAIGVGERGFTAVGIGDMSGDVFGNAMLLSPSMRLVAAFDHRHVFIDPQPDPVRSLAERARLAALPTSSWADYDESAISEGGGVFSRAAKAVDLAAPAREALGLAGEAILIPDDIVRAILLAPVDLLFNGGIGTFVKASAESNLDVGDKANDAVRVDGSELRARVVVEGGNLGLTQAGRIEAARNGVALNTDAIDNVAGVDCSDHEVNIKIALGTLVADDAMARSERDVMLASMRDRVAESVLEDAYRQNMLLGNARAQSAVLFPVHVRLIADLERRGVLDRGLANLPDPDECERRLAAGQGLVSPELAMLVAFVKIDLNEALLASDVMSEPFAAAALRDYFPAALVDRMPPGALAQHPLAHEIVATELSNEVVNFAGTSFVFRAQEETRADPVDVVRAYIIVREVFGFWGIWRRLRELDGEVQTSLQSQLQMTFRRLLDRAVRWLITMRAGTLDVEGEIQKLGPHVAELSPTVIEMLSGPDLRQVRETMTALEHDGAPSALAQDAAVCLDQFSLLDVSEIADRPEIRGQVPVQRVAEIFFALSGDFGLGDLLQQIAGLPRANHWDNMARLSLRTDAYQAVARLALRVIRTAQHEGTIGTATSADLIARWKESNRGGLRRMESIMDGVRAADRDDLAVLGVAVRAMRTLATQDVGRTA